MNAKLFITGIQSNLYWEDKVANLNMFEKKINSIKESTEIIVLPEMFSTGFSMNPEKLGEQMDGETVQWMRRISSEKNLILTGSVIIGQAAQSGQIEYFNRLIWMLPNGEYGFYDKRHLFAYASEDKHYTKGNKRLIATANGWKINLQICYDLRFPIWSRLTTNPSPQSGKGAAALEYDVIIYVANWPDRRSNAWKTLLQARAIENQCYVVGVNRIGKDADNNNHAGDSMVVDPLGEVLYHLKDDEDTFTCNLEKSHLESIRQKLPFWKEADAFRILE